MADRQGRIEIDATIDASLQAALQGMSASLRNVLDVTNSFAKAGVNNVNTAQALTKALTNATSASSLYSRASEGLARNQAVLGKYFRDTSVAAAQLEKQLKSNTNATQDERKAVEQLISSLKAQSNARKEIMKYSAQADLRRQSDALNQLSSRYSMAGTRMSMALTLPIASFMRSSFANYRRLETETIRTTKLISDSYTRAADVAGIAGAKLSKDQLSYTRELNGTIRTLLTLEGAHKRLGEELDEVSTRYGIARELVQGLAGDFAELGIEEVDTLAGLVDLTAGVEKLGNLDIGASQEFIKSIFQTILRIKRDTGTLERTADGFIDYSNAVAETTQQLALFNLIENKTQMSLKDIAKGFPEVTAAATSFGLTMTEATALVVPMVSAGMQVGASANSVKVSLQRVVDLTKENSKMIDTLKSSYAGFNTEAGVSIKTVQSLADSYNSMKRGALAEQGTLEFFSRLFGVRQGPRMEVAIQNLAQFQDQLTKGLRALDKDDTASETIEGILARKLEQAIQQQAKAQGLGEQFTSFTVKKFEDLGNVVRLSQDKDEKTAKAFSNARNQLAEYVKDEAQKGNDLISKISTESGKALFIGAVGNVEGKRKFEAEVRASLESVEVRYQRARELIKSIGRQLVPVLAEILSAVLPVLQKINDVFTKIPSWVKYVVSFGLIMLATIGPILKLAGSLFQLRSAMFSLKAAGGIFGRLKPQGNEISAELIAASDAAFRFKNVLTEVGGKFFLKGTKKEIRDLNRLMRLEMQGASPEKIAALEKKLKLKTTADMSGVSMSTIQAKQATGFDSFMGYAKQLFEDPAIPAAIMTYTAAVEKLGETITATLRVIGESFGFDPASIVAQAKPAPTSGGTTTSAGLPRKGGKGKGGSSGGTSGGSGGSGGGSPAGGSPSGGTSPGGSGATAVTPSTPPAEPAPTAVKLDRDIVAEPDPVVEQALTAYEQALADLKGATKKQLIELAKQLGIEKISGLSIKSNLLKVGKLREAIAKAQTEVKEKVEEAIEGDFKDAKEKIKSVNTKAPPAKGKGSKKVEDASEAVTDVVAEAQAEKDAVVVKEQGEEDATATKKKTGRKSRGGSKKVEDSSEKGAEIVAESQAEVDVDAVEEQSENDRKTVKESTTKPTRKGTRKLKDAVEKVVEAADDAVEEAVKGFASPKDIYEFFNPPGSHSKRYGRAKEAREREKRETPRYTVGELPRNARSLDEEFGSTESDARKKPKKGRIPESNFIRLDLARKLSTVQQLIQNALSAEQIQYELDMQIRSIKDIVEAAGIVVTETKTKGPRYEITKEAFLNLAKVLGIQLPPAFEKMGELVGRNGKALQTYQDGLENLIYSLTSTINFALNDADPELQMVLKQFPELVNTMILEFEYNLLRAFAGGKAGLFNFNLPFSGKESGDSLSGRFRRALEPVMGVSQKATAAQRAESSKRTASEEALEEDRLTKEREAEIRREKAEKARAERAADVDRKKRKQQDDQRRKEESRLAPGQTIEDKIIQDEQTRRVVSQGQRKPRSYGVLFNLKDQINKAIKPRDQVINDFIRAFREKIGQVRELKLSPQEMQKRIDEIVQQAKEAAKGVKLKKDALKIPEAVPVKPKRATGLGNFATPKDEKIIATTVDKPVKPEIIENAEKQYLERLKALKEIEAVASGLRMVTPEYQKREPRFAKGSLERLKKDGEKFGFEVQDTIEEVDKNREQILLEINKRIEQARIDVEKAKLAVQDAYAATRGGGGTGTTAMGLPSVAMTDPFGMPIGPRGPKPPRIGPMSIAFVDKGDITGGVASVYELIRQKLNIPAEVMQEVINQLRNGYTDATGKVRNAQGAVDKIGIKLSTEIGAGLDELVVILAQAIGGATDSVEIIRQAIVDKRNEFYALAKKAAKESEKADRKQLGFGISRDERLKLAEQVANKIREEKAAFDNFLEYQADTLRYIARQFGFTGSGTAAEMRNFLLGRFSSDELGYKILGATEESINAAIEASKEATEKVKKKAETSKKKAEKKAEDAVEEVVEEKPKKAPRKKKEPFVYPSTLQIIQALKPTMPERFVPEPVATEKPKKPSVRLPRGYTKAYMEQLMSIVKPAFEATVEDFASMTKQDLLANLGVFKAIEKDTKAFNYIFEKYGIDIRELINKTVGEIRSRRPVAPDISSIIPKNILNTDIYKEFMSIGIPLQALEDEFQYMQKIIKLSINDLAKESEQSLREMYNTFTVLKDDTNLVGILLKDMGIDIDMAMEDLRAAIDRIDENKKYVASAATTASTTATTAATGGRKPPVTATTTATATTATATATATATRNLNIFSGSLNLLSNGLKKTGSVALFALQPYIYASKTLVPALFNLYTATLKATLGFIPFGRSIYAVVAPIVSIPKVLLNAAKTAKQANSGFKGFVKELKTVLSNGADSLKQTVKEKFGKIFSAPAGAIGGFGKNIKSGVMSNIGMSAGMLGTSPLGMFGGNMLQSLITSLGSIPIIGMPVVLTLTAITGAIAVLAKTQKAWGDKTPQTLKNFKDAFAEIKAAGIALLKPLEDLFGVLAGGSDQSGTATDKAKSKFEKFSSFILGVSKSIRNFVENTLAPAFRVLLSVILVLLRKLAPVVSSAFNLMTAVYNEYTKKVEKQKERLENAFEGPYAKASAAAFRFAEENTKSIQSIEDAWNDFKTKFGTLLGAFGTLVSGFVGNLVIDIFKVITKLFVDGFEQIFIGINNLIALAIKGVAYLAVEGVKLLVVAFIKGFSILGNIPIIGKGIKTGLDAAASSVSNVFDSIRDGAVGSIGGAIDPIFNAINRSTGSLSNITDGLFEKLKESNKKKFVAQAREMIEGVLPDGAGSGLFKSFSRLITQAFKDPAAAKAAGEAIKETLKKQAEAVKDINSKFFDKAVSQLEKAMGKMTSQLTSYLNKQKDDALKAFDDQIAGIEALADAEERLTATEEYESNRRQRIKDRELQRNNYQKERALAIYEGRIDDARNLDLEELKNFEDYSKEISDMDKARQKDLQSQNRQDAITVIRNQKDAASKLFDEAIKEFEDYIEEQLRNGTTSETEFREQFERIAAKAQLTSTQMNTTFSTFFTNLPSQIQSGMNPVTSSAGFFSTGMDALVNIAKSKFGIDTQTGGASGSILGVTQAMLSGSNGMSSIISRAFATDGVIRTAYGSGIDSLNTYISDKLTGTGDTSLSGLFKDAMAKANIDFLAEIEKSKTGAGSKIEGLAKHLNEKFKAIALKDIMKDAIADAKKEIENAIKDTGGTGGSNTTNAEGFWLRRGNQGPDDWVRISGKSLDWINKLDRNRYRVVYSPGVKPNFFKGGRMSYGMGGPTVGPEQQGIPATLHGGEYVIRKKAVDKYGWGMMDRINTGTYQPKQYKIGGLVKGSSKVKNKKQPIAPSPTTPSVPEGYDTWAEYFNENSIKQTPKTFFTDKKKGKKLNAWNDPTWSYKDFNVNTSGFSDLLRVAGQGITDSGDFLIKQPLLSFGRTLSLKNQKTILSSKASLQQKAAAGVEDFFNIWSLATLGASGKIGNLISGGIKGAGDDAARTMLPKTPKITGKGIKPFISKIRNRKFNKEAARILEEWKYSPLYDFLQSESSRENLLGNTLNQQLQLGLFGGKDVDSTLLAFFNEIDELSLRLPKSYEQWVQESGMNSTLFEMIDDLFRRQRGQNPKSDYERYMDWMFRPKDITSPREMDDFIRQIDLANNPASNLSAKITPESSEVSRWYKETLNRINFISDFRQEIRNIIPANSSDRDILDLIQNVQLEFYNKNRPILPFGKAFQSDFRGDFGFDLEGIWTNPKNIQQKPQSVWDANIGMMNSLGYGSPRPTPKIIKSALSRRIGKARLNKLANGATKFETGPITDPVIKRLQELSRNNKTPLDEFIARLSLDAGLNVNDYIQGLRQSWGEGFRFYNGGHVPSYKKGGLVKGKTSAAQFRMADSIDTWDIQRIAYNAEQEAKNKKKNIFQKIGSKIASPFKAIKNKLQEEMFGAMYGKGTGTTGSYADTFKGFTEATNDASLFNITGDSNKELPARSLFRNAAILKASKAIRVGMDFTPSGGIMSAYNAADPNRSGLSRAGWGLSSFASIAGNPTIFAPNSGYMTGAGKVGLAKSPLRNTISEELYYLKRGLLNREQSIGIRDGRPLRIPTREVWYDFAQKQRSRAQRDTRLVGMGINDPLIDAFGNVNSVKDTYNPYSNSIIREMFANRYARNTMGLTDKIIYPTLPRIISRKLTKGVPMLDYGRGRLAFSKDYREQAYAEDALMLLRGEEPYSVVRSPLKSALSSFKERGLDAVVNKIPLKKNINNLVPYNSSVRTSTLDEYYQIAYSNYKYVQGLQKQLLRQRVLGNIEKSKLGRTGGFRTSNTVFDIIERLEKEFAGYNSAYFNKMSKAEKIKAVQFPGIKDVSLKHEIMGSSHTVSLLRKGFPADYITDLPAEKSLFASSSFNFGLYPNGDGTSNLNIGGLYGLKDFTSTDVPNLLAYVYANVIKPNNVTRITNGSYSKYSYALSRQLSDMMSELDPSVEVVTPSIFDWRPNNIDFPRTMGILDFNTEQEALEYFNQLNVLKDPIKSIKTKASVKEIVKARSRSRKKGNVIYSPDELERAQSVARTYLEELEKYMTSIRSQFNTRAYPYGPFGLGLPTPSLLNLDSYDNYFSDLSISRFIYPHRNMSTYDQDPIEALLELFKEMKNPILPSPATSSPWPRRTDGMFNGGPVPYAQGGPTFGPMNQGIPATLHGGEFVLRKSAVDKYGLEMLSQMNNGIYIPKVPKFNMPMANYAKISGAGSAAQMSSSETTHNYNFFVDNFIGETEWFNSMMKEYNMKVVPANQKQAGLESRVIRTYNGLNRGM